VGLEEEHTYSTVLSTVMGYPKSWMDKFHAKPKPHTKKWMIGYGWIG